jgi:hypothetical protein
MGTYLEAAERREPVNGEFRIRSKAGDYRWLLALKDASIILHHYRAPVEGSIGKSVLRIDYKANS